MKEGKRDRNERDLASGSSLPALVVDEVRVTQLPAGEEGDLPCRMYVSGVSESR